MSFDKFGGYLSIAFFSLYAFWYHGLIAHKKQCSRWDFVIETNGENGGGFHVNCIGPYFLEIFFEIFVMLPHAAIRRIHGTCPCLLYTSDAADERSSVDLGGRRII